MRRIELFYSFLTLIIDTILLFGVFVFAYYLRYYFAVTTLPYGIKIDIKDYFTLLFLLIPVWIAIFFFSGVYRFELTRRIFSEIASIFWAVTFSVVITTTLMFILRDVDFSRLMLIYMWVLAFVVLSLFRIGFFYFRRFLVRYGLGLKRVLIIGENGPANDLIDFFEKNPGYGYKVVKTVTIHDELGLKQIEKIIDQNRINEIILSEGFSEAEKNWKLLRLAQEKQVVYRQIPSIYELRRGAFNFETIGDVPLIRFRGTPLDGWGRIAKRFIDFILSLIILIILSPLFLIVAIIIKLDSSGPVFFKQLRVAKRGTFCVYKFRSMIDNAEALKKDLILKNEREDGPLFKIKNDPRITRIGKLLRQSRIDELPQFYNVLRGEMSLVGPRPHLPSEVAQYKKHQKKVLLIKPGVTGLAQISGASDLSFDDEVRLDAYYIENWSLWLDFIIMFKTFGVILKGQGAA